MAAESSASELPTDLHLRALRAARDLKSAEGELVEVIRLVDESKLFSERGHPSLFQYAVSELGLSESTAYAFITVARKSREVPVLARKIREGSITVSQARKIVPVLTKEEDPSEWIEKAAHLSQRRLEKEVATVRPEVRTPERASYVSSSRVKLELGLSEFEMLRLRRVQDLLSQSRKRSVSLEETLAVLAGEYLRRHDPVEKAKRHQVRKGGRDHSEEAPKNPTEPVETLESIPAPAAIRGVSSTRVPIPASIKHQVYLRDGGRCTQANPDGKRCGRRRWIEIHHILPVSEGGANELSNLATLCSAHHRFVHAKERN